MKIFHTENAGVYLRTETTGLLIDGVHGGASVGFSPMAPEEIRQIESREGIFSRLDGLLFTHLHIDHFQAKKVTELMRHYPDLAIWGPNLERRHLMDYVEEGEDVRFRIGDLTVFAIRTEHSGKPFQKEPHMSLLITDEKGENVFISGDAAFYPEQAERVREISGGIDAIFIMIYQLIETGSRHFLNALRPRRILLYHKPRPEEDKNGLLPLTEKVLRNPSFAGVTIEVPEPHSWI